MAGKIEFEFRFSRPRDQSAAGASQDAPMRILMMGDFSGRGRLGKAGPGPPLAGRRPLAIDVDTVEEVMARLAPRAALPLGGPGADAVEVVFESLEHFHPDHLYAELEPFRALRLLRKRLLDPETSAPVIAELSPPGLPRPAQASPTAIRADSAGPGSPERDAAMLERLLGQRPAQVGGSRGGRQVDISRFIQRVVGPHIVPEAHPQQSQVLASLDAATGTAMREVLRDPGFQALESAWRSLHRLASGTETGEDLKLYILDISRQELEGDLAQAGSDLERSALYRLLVETHGPLTAGGQPWSVLAGDYTFGTGPDDVRLLAAMGAVASQAGGPFLAACNPMVLGCRSLAVSPDPVDWTHRDEEAARRWQALRASPAAAYIGLALPRVLVRLPYGRRGEEVESFAFEELPPGRDHEAYLWGNPAFACAALIAEAYTLSGWTMQAGDRLDIENLPAHTYDDDGEARMMPCAEVYLAERAGDAILGHGVMPVMSYRNRDTAHVVRFQSLADPPAPLSGPWA